MNIVYVLGTVPYWDVLLNDIFTVNIHKLQKFGAMYSIETDYY